MLRKRSALLCLAALGALSLGTVAAARPKPQEFPQPTAEHAMLLEAVGTWEGTVVMTGMPPTPAKETVEALAPFWTHARFESEIMGMPFTGLGCTGYDPEKKKFVGTWIDSMSTFLAVMEGDYDAATKTLTMHWQGPDMMSGGLVAHRMQTVFTENAYTSKMFMGEGDAAMEVMTIAMQRKGKQPVEAGAGR